MYKTICNILKAANMEKYINLFKENGVDDELFLTFTKEDLEYLQIPQDDIIILLDVIKHLRKNDVQYPKEITFSRDEVKLLLDSSLKHVKNLHIGTRFISQILHRRNLEDSFVQDGRPTVDIIKHVSDKLITELTREKSNNYDIDAEDANHISQNKRRLQIETFIVFVVANFIYFSFTNLINYLA